MLEQKLEELTCAINALTGMLATIGMVAKEANAPAQRGRKPKAQEEAPAPAEPVEEAPEQPAAAAGDGAVGPAPTPEEAAAAVAEEAPEQPVYTQGQIADLVLLVAKVRGREAALAALAELGVRKASELDPADFPRAAEVLNAAASA